MCGWINRGADGEKTGKKIRGKGLHLFYAPQEKRENSTFPKSEIHLFEK